MGQIVGGAAKPKRCNLNQLSQVPTPAAGEYILVSSDNSMNAAGQGNFDCYIVGDGQKAATALELKTIDVSLDIFNTEDLTSSVVSGYIRTNGDIGTTVDTTVLADASNRNLVVSVAQGDIMTIKGQGQGANRLWAFTDEDYILLSHAAAGELIENDTDFVASEDGYFIFNIVTNHPYSIKKTHKSGTYLDLVDQLVADVDSLRNDIPDVVNNLTEGGSTSALSAEMGKTLEGEISSIRDDLSTKETEDITTSVVSGYIVTNVGIGNVVDTTVLADATNRNLVVPVEVGDIMTITGQGQGINRLWAFTDESYKLLSIADAGLLIEEETNFTAEQKGYFIYNIIINHAYSIKKTSSSGSVIDTINQLVEDVQELKEKEQDTASNLVNFPEIDLSFDFANSASDFGAITKKSTCAELYALWDSLVTTTGYGVKVDTTQDTGLTTPSHQPSPVYIYKFLCNKAYSDKSKHIKVLIYAGEHANEWSAPYVLLGMMKEICEKWSSDRNSALLLSLVDFYVIPCLCPWGYEHASRTNYNGVNINRNFASSNWKSGSTGDDYGGTSAASEFETKTIQWYVDNLKPDIFMDIHAGGTNSHGAIGTIECSIDDGEYQPQFYYDLFTNMARTASNRFIIDDNNYPNSLNQALIDTNFYLQSVILTDTTTPYTGCGQDYAMQNGVKMSMLTELCAKSDWKNGVYNTSDYETVTSSAILARGNVKFLMNSVYRAIKALSDSYFKVSE